MNGEGARRLFYNPNAVAKFGGPDGYFAFVRVMFVQSTCSQQFSPPCDQRRQNSACNRR
jgi:hypothetical protein